MQLPGGWGAAGAAAMSSQVARPPPTFKPPTWVAQAGAVEPTVLVAPGAKPIDVGARGSFVIGRVETADIMLEHSSVSRHHCALAHHCDGRVYIVDLQSACGTKIDGRRIEPHKPVELRLNHRISFGEDTTAYQLLRGTPSQPKRPAESDGGSTNKRARADDGPDSVQCRHLLIKHCESRFKAPATFATSSNPLRRGQQVTRSKSDALTILQGHMEALRADSSDAAFAALATSESCVMAC